MSTSETFAPDASLADVGEFALIAALASRFAQGPHVYVGPGDDAAVVRTPKGHVVVSTDILVEGQHFKREWASARDIGRKAVASNLSDISAMGGRAHSLTIGLAAPAGLPVAWVLELADGIAEEAALVGASVVGGDLTTATEVVIAVTVLGTCEVSPVLRSGAAAGDIVALAGRQGWAAAGLAVLARGFRSPRAVVEAYQRPQPPYAAGPAAAAAGATAMIDVSDGLIADLGHIAGDSVVSIDLDRGAFEVADTMTAVGSALGVDPMGFILGGGDDHALVATFAPDATLPEGFSVIGRVAAPHDSGAESLGAVTVDGADYEGPTGWKHFG